MDQMLIATSSTIVICHGQVLCHHTLSLALSQVSDRLIGELLLLTLSFDGHHRSWLVTQL